MDPNPVIQALEAALELAPGDTALRTELVRQLLIANLAERALPHIHVLIDTDPTNPDFLDLAIEAHRAVGDDDAATAFSLVSDSLRREPVEPVKPLDFNASNDGSERELPVPDTADELLDAWSKSAPLEEVNFGEMTRPSVKLSDVGGLDGVKRQIELSFLSPIKNPEVAASFGKTGEGGLLLWGPPGCGKTFLARAIAGEMNANFYSVAITDVLEMWQGKSAQNLGAIFDAARENTPCVLFFDEVDALGHKRSNLAFAPGLRNVVNQLLAELDGVLTDNTGLFVLGATNHPWDVDSALLRPGRFDRRLLVLPPDSVARESILHFHLRGMPLDSVDVSTLVAHTDGFSGADLRLVVETATEECLASSMDRGTIVPITTGHLNDALATLKSTIGPWLENARNHVLYANQSGDYDELATYMKRLDAEG